MVRFPKTMILVLLTEFLHCLLDLHIKKIYLFMAVLGLCCAHQLSPAAVTGGCSLVLVLWPLIVMVSLVAEHGF